MKKYFSAFFAAAVAVIAICFITIAPASASRSITITATNFTFSPAVVHLKKGEPVTLHLRSAQGVHGLNVPQIGIQNVTMTPTDRIVTITPHKTGTFVSKCSVFCGAGHATMAMTFIVK